MRHIPDYPLWLGHAGDARDKHELLRLGIGAVVYLAVEESPAVAGHETVYCRFPLVDGTARSEPPRKPGIDWPLTWPGITNCAVDVLYFAPTQQLNQLGPTIDAA